VDLLEVPDIDLFEYTREAGGGGGPGKQMMPEGHSSRMRGLKKSKKGGKGLNLKYKRKEEP